MKTHYKLLVSAFILSGVSGIFSLACGQSNSLQAGARLGLSVSYFGESANFNGGNPGLIIGGSIQYNLLDFLGASAELTFHQQRGTRSEAPVVDPAFTKVTESNLTLNALELPILAVVSLPEFGGISLKAKAGYSFAYTLGVINKDVNHYYFTDGTYLNLKGSENVTSNYYKAQHSLIGSLGFALPVDSSLFSEVSFDFRYRKGMSPVENSYSVLEGKTNKIYSQSLQVILGFTF